MFDLSNLNDKQKDAVLCEKDKIMVMAGAGSGKTKVLTTRIAYLIKEKNIKPENILALTFTNKASNEMKERIEKVTNISKKEIQAMTFHSFCVKVLRKFVRKLNLNYTENFKILAPNDVKKVMSDLLEKNDIDVKKVNDVLTLRNAVTFKNKSCSPKEKEVILEFNKYLIINNAMIFDDLLYYTYILLLKNIEVSIYYQNNLKYVLVDEYQDTDDIQYEILKIITAFHKKLFVVGDDFQAIYSFRDANVKNILKFQKDFPDFELIILNQNYRSTPEILNVANKVIKENKNQIEKDLFTNNLDGENPTFQKFNYYRDEAENIANLIVRLVNDGYQYKDITILYRNNSLSRSFEDELILNKIPYLVHNGTSFYERQEIKDLLSFLYVIADDYDNIAFKEVINKPKRKIGKAIINKLEDDAIKKQSANHYSLLLECKNSDNKELAKFYDDILKIRSCYFKQSEDDNPSFKLSDVINYIISYMNYASHLTYLGSSSTNDRHANVDELKVILQEYEKGDMLESEPNTNDFIFEVLQNILLFSKEDVSDEEGKDAVNLMTLHASKGLEFKVVFLPALEEGIFPSKHAESEEEIEEERRLFYVGVTRAKEKLYLSSVRERIIFGQRMLEYTSRFVSESSTTLKFR